MKWQKEKVTDTYVNHHLFLVLTAYCVVWSYKMAKEMLSDKYKQEYSLAIVLYWIVTDKVIKWLKSQKERTTCM